MDVVVIPTGSEGASWRLNDRLGRPLGHIERSGLATGFEIKPGRAADCERCRRFTRRSTTP